MTLIPTTDNTGKQYLMAKNYEKGKGKVCILMKK